MRGSACRSRDVPIELVIIANHNDRMEEMNQSRGAAAAMFNPLFRVWTRGSQRDSASGSSGSRFLVRRVRHNVPSA